MKFVEIKEGVCLRKEDITAIEATADMGCKVYIGSVVYDSIFSYGSLKALLEMSNDVEETASNYQQESGQYWAG